MKLIACLLFASALYAQYTPQFYCADAGASDTYACNLQPAPTAYVVGQVYTFKANTVNTGPASINFNSLGALTITKSTGGITQALTSNEIRAGQTVQCVYDGTNCLMISASGAVGVPDTSSATVGVYLMGASPIINTYPGTSGSNTFLGILSGNFTLTGSANTVVGKNSGGALTDGLQNTVIGQGSGNAITGGDNNTVVGQASLTFNTTGNLNTAIGQNSMVGDTGQNGDRNTGVGSDSCFALTTGDDNTCLGYASAAALTTGLKNTIVGTLAGNKVITGSNNVMIGYGAGPTATDVSNALYIDITERDTPLIGGDFSARTLSFPATVTSTKYATTTNCADSAGAAACGSAPAGAFVIDAGSTSTVVSTTAVTANSEIFVEFDSSLGTRLSVTCNTNRATAAFISVTARTAATSFTVTISGTLATNPGCFTYHIVN